MGNIDEGLTRHFPPTFQSFYKETALKQHVRFSPHAVLKMTLLSLSEKDVSFIMTHGVRRINGRGVCYMLNPGGFYPEKSVSKKTKRLIKTRVFTSHDERTVITVITNRGKPHNNLD